MQKKMVDMVFEGLLRVADDNLILGHRTSEWCGHAPTLEEDLALPNIALDLIGHAQALYSLACELKPEYKNEESLLSSHRLSNKNGTMDIGHLSLNQLNKINEI